MRASPAPSDAVEYAGDEGAAPRQPGTKHPGTMQLLEIIQDQEGGTGGTPLPLKSQGTAGGPRSGIQSSELNEPVLRRSSRHVGQIGAFSIRLVMIQSLWNSWPHGSLLVCSSLRFCRQMAHTSSSSSARVRDWNANIFPRKMDPYSNGLERKRALGSVVPYAELPVDHFSFFVRSRAFNALKFCLQPSPTFHCYSVCVRNSKALPRSHSIYFSTAS